MVCVSRSGRSLLTFRLSSCLTVAYENRNPTQIASQEDFYDRKNWGGGEFLRVRYNPVVPDNLKQQFQPCYRKWFFFPSLSFPQWLSTMVFEAQSLTDLDLARLVGWLCQQDKESACVYFLSTDITDVWGHAWLSLVLEIWSRWLNHLPVIVLSFEWGLNELMQALHLLHYLVHFKHTILSFKNLFVQKLLVFPAVTNVYRCYLGGTLDSKQAWIFADTTQCLSVEQMVNLVSLYKSPTHHSMLGYVWWFVVNIHKTWTHQS